MRELPGGSIVPVAQGVDTFLRPAARNQQAGLPQLRVLSSNPLQMQTTVAGTGGSTEGSNQWAQLANALQPFNAALTKAAGAGVELYASTEYQKGRNDAVRAQVLANQQRLRAGAEYAAQNRAVDAVDPIAGQLMDRVNPFRQAGRENQLARLAAGEVKTTVLDAYRSTPEANTWEPNDPRLAQIKVDATKGLLQKYGLSETSAGFQDYVNPEIAQAWDRVSSEHYDAFSAFQKSTVAPMAAVEMLQSYANARTEGSVTYRGFDDDTGERIVLTAAVGDPNFKNVMQLVLGQSISRIRAEMGLRGETTETIRKTIDYLREVTYSRLTQAKTEEEEGEMTEFLEILQGVPVGPKGKDGKRPRAWSMFAPDFAEDESQSREEIRAEKRWRYEEQARQEATLQRGYEDELAMVLSEYPEASPERGAALLELEAEWKKKGMGKAQMLEATDKYGRVVGNIAEREAVRTGPEELLGALDAIGPAGFNRARALLELKARIAGMPDDVQAEYLKRFHVMATAKEKEAQNSKRGIIDPILRQGVIAALQREYPESIAAALKLGLKDIEGFIAFNDANLSTATTRLSEGARKHMQARIDEAEVKAGGRLNNTQQTAIATQALNEYLATKDENLRKYLFPGGLSGGPGVQGGKVEPPQSGTGNPEPPPPPGRQWSRTPTVTSSNLDNVDPKVLQRGDVVLEKPSAMKEVMRVLDGQAPSAAVQRAARAAGMSPARWLLRQSDGYPGLLGPAERKRLLDKANKATAAGQKISSSGRPSPFAVAGNWLADIMLGIQPARAASRGGMPFHSLRSRFTEGSEGQTMLASPRGLKPAELGSGFGAHESFRRRPHEGQDAAIAQGTPLGLGVGGTVVRVSRTNSRASEANGGYGNFVDVQLPNGSVIRMAHLSRIPDNIRNGTPISPNQIIAYSGGAKGEVGSGRSTGPHLHLEHLSGRMGTAETTRGKLNPSRSGAIGLIRVGSPGASGGRGSGARGAMTGMATFYTGSGGSDGVLGGRTANGEVFTGKQMTAAVQWSLKPRLMNKWLIVEDVNTGRKVRVWANDTGQMGGTEKKPADRLIDLSPVAFTRLFGSTSRGVERIRVMVDPNQRGKP